MIYKYSSQIHYIGRIGMTTANTWTKSHWVARPRAGGLREQSQQKQSFLVVDSTCSKGAGLTGLPKVP